MKALSCLVLIGCLALVSPAEAQQFASATEPELGPNGQQQPELSQDSVSWLESLRRRYEMRLAFDLSYRVVHSDVLGEYAGIGAVGIDVYKTFRGTDGDWGTLILQPYLTRIDNVQMHPPFFDGPDDWELVYRICNFNYTGLARGRFNVRVGHFEIPYGLEHLVNTNGTLLDYTSPRNLGLKADWGAGINGEFPGWEYEIDLSRGSGNEYDDEGDPFVVAGRLGTDRRENLILGLSGFHGEFDNAGATGTWRSGFDDPSTAPDVGNRIRRTRIGTDAQWRTGPIDLLGEVSVGRDYDQDVLNGLLEVDWRDQRETWLVYLQSILYRQRFQSGWVDDVSLAAGVRYTPGPGWSLSTQVIQKLENFADVENDTVVALQLRYRL